MTVEQNKRIHNNEVFTLQCTINKVNAEMTTTRVSIFLGRVGNYLELITTKWYHCTVPPRILIIFFGEPNFSKFLAVEFKIKMGVGLSIIFSHFL